MVWDHQAYRAISPGERDCERAYQLFGSRVGPKIIDYGSGPARATKWFADKGMMAIGIDIAPNAAETDVEVIEACLWDLPAHIGVSDYAYCCDVMEHIPPLRHISIRTVTAGYFRIATRPDRMGPALIGAPLHLTIRPANWWYEKLSEFFSSVEVIEDKRAAVFLVEGHHFAVL